MELLGKRWSALLVRVLMEGPRRFSELGEAVPLLSERMLSERLKELEGVGVVERVVHAGPPVKVEYNLTQKGLSLSGVLEEIGRWAEKWVTVEGARHSPHALTVTRSKRAKRSD